MFRDAIAFAVGEDRLIVELSSVEQVLQFQADQNLLSNLSTRSVAITAKSTGQYDFISRYFAPKLGIPEDPVTGSIHCALIDYWEKKLLKSEFTALQASQRSGKLFLKRVDDRVHISGSCITVLKGDFLFSNSQK